MISYGLTASVVLHVLVFLLLGYWLSHSSMRKLAVTASKAAPEPEEILIFAQSIDLVPAPEVKKKEQEQYLRTTQNTESEAAPANPAFISDRNTAASSRLPGTVDGKMNLPTTNGVDQPTMELANRDFKAGETKQDSALLTPPTQAAPAPPPLPEVKPTPPAPKPEVAKKQDSPTEKMMQELDEKMGDQSKERLPLEVRPPEPKTEEARQPDEPPAMRSPEPSQIPKAEPVVEPLVNAPRPEKDAFQPQTRVGKVAGAVNQPGLEDSVDAAATPKGRYMRQVTGAIEKRWHYLSRERPDSVQPGRLRLLFYVDRFGNVKPENIVTLYDKAPPFLKEFTLLAVLQAEIPPIPANLLPTLDGERLEIEYEFVIY
jgi:hypothetical protein